LLLIKRIQQIQSLIPFYGLWSGDLLSLEMEKRPHDPLIFTNIYLNPRYFCFYTVQFSCSTDIAYASSIGIQHFGLVTKKKETKIFNLDFVLRQTYGDPCDTTETPILYKCIVPFSGADGDRIFV
jgi:hypothetical protein